MPILPTLQHYQASWFGADVVAGLTLFAIAVPEQMATARLANLPAVIGLYAFGAGSLIFALLGPHRQMSVGADSTIAPVFAAGVATVAAVGTAGYADLVALMALMVGVLVAAVGLLRLGWIADFLSNPVVTGIMAGIALEIVLRQLPAVLGIPGGGTTAVARLRAVVRQAGQVNGWTVGIAVAVLVIVVGAEQLNRLIPGPLVALVASTAAVAAFGLDAHGVVTLGSVQAGLPPLRIPPIHLDDARRVLGPAVTVAFVCVVQTAATARSSIANSPTVHSPTAGAPTAGAPTAGSDPAADFDRDLIALGAGNLLAGATGSFPVNASPPRTAIVAATGGRSQLTSLVATGAVLAVVLLATGVIKDLPQATLGGILIFVASRLFRAAELRRILRFDRFEFALAVITAVVVAFVGVEQGIVVAVLLALAQRTRLAAQPRDAILGREPGTDHWIPPDVGRPTEAVPGVVVYLLYAPLWYGDATYVVARIRQAVAAAPPPVRALVLDSNGISDIDYTAARALGELVTELRGRGVRIGVARASHLVHHDLKLSGVLGVIGAEAIFATVADAVGGLSNGG